MSVYEQMLAFEHSLRAHVQSFRERITQYNDDLGGSDDPEWTIRYRAEDGGLWEVVLPFRYRVDASFKAAMLSDALHNAYTTVITQRNSCVLPSLLTKE